MAVLLPLLTALSLFFTNPSPVRAEVSITDDTGYTLTLEKPATRVVALYGAFNELMLAMGMDRQLVGRTAADGDIPELKHLPAVGTHMRPNAELIVSLKPDVVLQLIGRREAESFSEGLRRLGVPVLLFKMDSFESMFSVLQRLGALLGEEERSQQLEARYRKNLRDVQQALMNEQRVRVFYEVRYPNLLGAGTDSIVNDIIHWAGGRNVLSTEGRVVRLNEEELIRHNPDVYLIQKGPMNPAPVPMDARSHFATLNAVQRGRIYVVDELAFARPGPRAVAAVAHLARLLHPHADLRPIRH